MISVPVSVIGKKFRPAQPASANRSVFFFYRVPARQMLSAPSVVYSDYTLTFIHSALQELIVSTMEQPVPYNLFNCAALRIDSSSFPVQSVAQWLHASTAPCKTLTSGLLRFENDVTTVLSVLKEVDRSRIRKSALFEPSAYLAEMFSDLNGHAKESATKLHCLLTNR